MGIMDDVRRNENLDRVPDLLRHGIDDYPNNAKGYPTKVEELPETGRFTAAVSGLFKIDRVSAFENEDSYSLRLQIKCLDEGPAKFDTFQLGFYLVPEELADPQGFIQQRSLRDFGALAKFARKNELLDEDWNPEDFTQGVPELCEAFKKAQDFQVELGVKVQVYKHKQTGELKGPYVNLNWLKVDAVSKTPF